jgi:hypothetical protein
MEGRYRGGIEQGQRVDNLLPLVLAILKSLIKKAKILGCEINTNYQRHKVCRRTWLDPLLLQDIVNCRQRPRNLKNLFSTEENIMNTYA